jgi:hypothetical protein
LKLRGQKGLERIRGQVSTFDKFRGVGDVVEKYHFIRAWD